MSNVRRRAMEIIYAVRYDGKYINQALQHVKLSNVQEMPLLTHIVYGTIKEYEYLEYLLEKYIDLQKSKRIVRVILVTTLYMHLYIDKIPMYALIDEAVEITKKLANQFAANFVNSTLRRVVADTDVESLPNDTLNEIEQIAIMQSVPTWLVQLVAKQYSLTDAAFFFSQMKDAPKQFARVNILRTTAAEVLAEDPKFIAVPDFPTALQYTGGNIAATSQYSNGEISVQNISSQLVAEALTPIAGEYIWDMCAAPGGKTTHIAELMGNTGRILASDLYEPRIALITAQAERLGVSIIEASALDAATYQSAEKFDRILLDAPCSGLGVMRQKPEIKYHVTPESLDTIDAIQKALLQNAVVNLRDKGTLLYSTCTINKKENEKQVQWLMKQSKEMTVTFEKTVFSEMQNGNSGFYYAILKKNILSDR